MRNSDKSNEYADKMHFQAKGLGMHFLHGGRSSDCVENHEKEYPDITITDEKE